MRMWQGVSDAEGQETDNGVTLTSSRGTNDNDDDDDDMMSIESPVENDVGGQLFEGEQGLPSVDSTDLHSLEEGLREGSGAVYDPCFWLPALHHMICQPSPSSLDEEKNQPLSSSVSVRLLANSGALSLLLGQLGARCPVLHSLALATLQRVLELARRQTADKDAGFKERPQLLLLLNFIRNAHQPREEGNNPPHLEGNTIDMDTLLRLPSGVTQFLSRAALHLMQPTHALFSPFNKYLLSRPFCDRKDVPLYDMLLVEADAHVEQTARLAVFRLVRDGLCSRQDHLNLCRKNAYTRLLLLFPLLSVGGSQAASCGHAVLDILDRALCLSYAAR